MEARLRRADQGVFGRRTGQIVHRPWSDVRQSSLKLAFVILAGLAVLPACANVGRTVDRNIRLFDELSFGGPYDNDLKQGKNLVKWDGPIRVILQGENVEKYRAEVSRQLNKVSKLTGLSIQLDESPSGETNYLIQFSAEEGFSIRKDFVPCSARINSKSGVINKARIKISTANESKISKCIAHEFMHSFGFRYHSGLVRSILSPAHGEDDFTRWDELMLTTLYSDRLSPGLSRTESLASARGLIEKALTE